MSRPLLSVPGKLQKVMRTQAKLRKIERIPAQSWKIVRGDIVQVMSAHKDEDIGKQGKVVRVCRKRNSVVVEGVNLRTRYLKRDRVMTGSMFRQEGLLHVANVALLDPKDKQPTSVKLQRAPDTGERLRISVRSGEVIPKPSELRMQKPDRFKTRNEETDTAPEVVQRVTYVPPAPATAASADA